MRTKSIQIDENFVIKVRIREGEKGNAAELWLRRKGTHGKETFMMSSPESMLTDEMLASAADPESVFYYVDDLLDKNEEAELTDGKIIIRRKKGEEGEK